MRIAKVRLKDFKRFKDLSVEGLGPEVRLVVLAGPNGCGKSSLFDAFSYYHYSKTGRGWDGAWDYYIRPGSQQTDIGQRIDIEFHGNKNTFKKGDFYFRSAYRQEADFTLKNLQKVGEPTEEDGQVRKMMLGDVSVSKNYQRLASQALVDAFAEAADTMTLSEFREKVIGELKRTTAKLFPHLLLNTLGNPLEEGTFKFDKGAVKGFKYKNLSGGEKAAFDLILDIVVKRRAYNDAIYCIDEPESHMNTKLQGKLLEAILEVMPERCQLWISTHSIGMMRKAQKLWLERPNSVAFLDLGEIEPDEAAKVEPSRPTREFWERVLAVALDDLASLVAPKQIVVCEGNPIGSVKSKNLEFDASCFNLIFADEFPDTKFISAGNASSVAEDRLGLVKALPLIAQGVSSKRLIDRDDHAPQDVVDFTSQGINVLPRRHIESFLYDDEVLTLLCASKGQEGKAAELIAEKQEALRASVLRGNAADDIKSIAGLVYVKAKQLLSLVAVGNDQNAFAKRTLAPLIKDGTNVYLELKTSIFS